MKRILISGYLGFDNFGDEALLYVLIRDLLQTGFKNTDITVISDNPNKTATNYYVNTVNRWNILEVIASIVNCNAIFFVGGLFQDKRSFQSFLYYYLQLLLSNFLKKEVVFYGSGIGPFQRKVTMDLFNSAIKNHHLITVRDKASANLFINKPNIQITCDPVWSIEGDFTFQNQIQTVNWQLPIVGVSLRNDKLLKIEKINDIGDKLLRLLSAMKDWQVLLIPCMPEQDLHVIYELYDFMIKKTTEKNRIILLENFSYFSITQQAGILASCDVMVGMRYHSLLVPLANGKPVFGLIYDQKVRSLIEFASQSSVFFKDIIDQPWSYFWQNLQNASDLARQAQEKASELHKINLQLLERLMNL